MGSPANMNKLNPLIRTEKIELQEQNDRLNQFIDIVKRTDKWDDSTQPDISIADLVEKQTKDLIGMVKDQEKKKLKIEKARDTLRARIQAEREKIQKAKMECGLLKVEIETTNLETDLELKQNEMLQEKIKYLKKIYIKRISELQTEWTNDTETDGAASELLNALIELREKHRCIIDKDDQKRMREMTAEINIMNQKILEHINGYEKLINAKVDVDTEISAYRMLLDRGVMRIEKVKPHKSTSDSNLIDMEKVIRMLEKEKEAKQIIISKQEAEQYQTQSSI